MTDTATPDTTTTPETTTIGPSTPISTQPDGERRLRIVLRFNALNSVVFGVLLAVTPDRIDQLLGTGHPGWVRLVGLGLLPFAALCAWLSTASLDHLRRVTPQVVAGDVAWVVASLATVLFGWYSGSGIVAVLAMAAVIDVFALLQWSSWRQLRAMR